MPLEAPVIKAVGPARAKEVEEEAVGEGTAGSSRRSMLGPTMRSDPDGTIRQHALLIVNPAAGCGRSLRAARALESALHAAGLPFTRQDTLGPGHARQLAAASPGPVVVVGGDGTVHEVVGGLPVRDGQLGPLAVLPCGSGDDFAGGVGFAPNPTDLVARLLGGVTRSIDVGLAEFPDSSSLAPRRFVNAAAFGLDAEVAARARQRRFLRGRLLYTMATLTVLRRPPRFLATITRDAGDGTPEVTTTTECAFVSTCNGPRVGGGLLLAPQARSDDGRFDVVQVAGASAPVILWLLAKLLVGRHRSDPRVRATTCVRVQITTPTEVAVALDGEPVPARVQGATFSFLPQRLLLLGAALA